jgi:uncharacterized delta-60 repeat protein
VRPWQWILRGRPWRAAAGLCVLGLAILAAQALAAAGALDHSFSGDGKRTFGFANGANGDRAYAVAVQNGKPVIAGESNQGGDYRFALARLNDNGGFDHSFAGDGRKTFGFGNGPASDAANAVAVQGGKIVVVGDSSQNAGGGMAVARLNPDGTLDHSFSGDGRRNLQFPNGGNSENAWAVAVQSNGKIVLAGESYQDNGNNDDFAVARLNPNGSLDHSFSGDGRRTFGFANGSDYDTAYGVATSSGKIVVAGNSQQDAGTNEQFAVARLNPNGSLDHSFSGDGKRTFGFASGAADDANAVAIEGGRVVLVGQSNQGGNRVAVARLNDNGGFDSSFSGDGRKTCVFADGVAGSGKAVAIQGNRIVVTGSSNQTGSEFGVARLNPNGGFDSSFSGDGRRTFGFPNGTFTDGAVGVAILGGNIVVAGHSFQSGTGYDFAVARLLGG